jgi:AcrR family transcriptional regulator
VTWHTCAQAYIFEVDIVTLVRVTLSGVSEPSGARQLRKQQTHQALVDAALRLVADQSFSNLSLREVTRAVGIVPTAFYRHFRDMDELGQALVVESFGTLRQMLRTARRDPRVVTDVARSSVDILIAHVRAHPRHFMFIARERFSGVAPLRQAINWELRLFVNELALDLSRIPGMDAWSTEDKQMLAELMVDVMVAAIEALLDVPAERPELEAELRRKVRKQFTIIGLGMAQWRSSRPGDAPRGEPLPTPA